MSGISESSYMHYRVYQSVAALAADMLPPSMT